MPKYIASVVSLIEVEATSLEDAKEKVLSTIHSKPWSDFNTELEEGYPELVDETTG